MKTAMSLDELVAMIPDAATLMVGGFFGVGCPAPPAPGPGLRRAKGLTVIANDTARPGVGVGKLIDARAVTRLIASHIGTNPETQRQMLAGEVEVDLVPQGTLAEKNPGGRLRPGRRVDQDRPGDGRRARQAHRQGG